MKDYLNYLIEKFPVRRTKVEKENFQKYVKEEITNYQVENQTLEKKHTNIVIGNVEDAKVIFTAHYDTPGRSLFPNLMLPKNYFLSLLYGFSIPIILAFIALAAAYSLTIIFNIEQALTGILYILIYFGVFFLFTRAYTNKNNANDNTSGVATILSLAQNSYDDVAFILFDNEEKGLLGSKAFKKANKEMMKNKVLINLDCVGNGNNILVVAKKKARETIVYNIMTETFISNDDYNVEYIPMEKARSNTDHKNYDLGIGILACKKAKSGIYYTPRIHTHQDVIVDVANIEFIVNNLNSLIEKI